MLTEEERTAILLIKTMKEDIPYLLKIYQTPHQKILQKNLKE